MESDIQDFEKLVTNCNLFLSGDTDLSELSTNLINNIKLTNEIYTNGFDDEQIWQQIEVSIYIHLNQSIIKNIYRF